MIKTRVFEWFRARFDVEMFAGVLQGQLRKLLPKNIGWFHTLGSMSLFLFVSQVVTGILLLVYYRPTEQEAFESVKFIMTKAYMGWLIREIHAWGSNLMIIIVFLHMLRTFISGSYKKPRELTWLIGVILFILTLTFGFTGYLLPWNQVSYWATTVGTEMIGSVPLMGEWVKTLLRGGSTVSGETLSRFFVMHVIVLPWILFFLVAAHLFLVRLQGIATLHPVGSKEDSKIEGGIPFYPHHMLKEGIVFFLLLGVLITLAILVPFGLGEKADPLETPFGIKPDWYFLPMYQVLKYFPKLVGIFVLALGPLMLLIWPFLDRNRERHPLKRPIAMAIFVLVLFSLLLFGFLGYVSETRKQIFGRTVQFDIYGMPHQEAGE